MKSMPVLTTTLQKTGRMSIGGIKMLVQRNTVMHRVGVRADFLAILTPAWWWWLSES